MKKVLFLVVVMCLMFSGSVFAVLSCDTVDAAGLCKKLNTGGVSYAGTCQVDGNSGVTSMNIDIDGSTDGVTFYSLVDDITTDGNYSFIERPFSFIRADVDAIAGTSDAVTVDCIWLPATN